MRRTHLTAYIFGLIVTASTVTFSIHLHEVRQAKQTILNEDRHLIQSAIHAYTVDKGQPPQSLNDLVDAGYLKALPQDPQNLPTQ
jgi:general secretion pathway protein G